MKAWLKERKIIYCDGGMGSLLMKRGMTPGMRTDEMNQAHPEAVESIQRAYAEAGSDVLYTNTFSLSSRLKDIDLMVGVHDDAVIAGMLKANDCDIAIMTPEKDPLFHTVPLYKDNYVFAASSGLIPQSHILRS